MLAVANQNYSMPNQTSVANELLNSIKKMFKNFMIEKEAKNNFINIQTHLLTLTREAHSLNAEIETLRDFINNYYINDIIQDEKILNKYSNMLDNATDKVDVILDNIQKSEMKKEIKRSLHDAFDDLHSTIVNVNFTISQNITLAYLDSKSNSEFLKEA